MPAEKAKLAKLEKNYDTNENDDAASSAYFDLLAELYMEYVPNFKKLAQASCNDDVLNVNQMIKFEKTVNMISDGKRVFTVGMSAKEKKYLESKGIEVIIVPLGDVDVGAGLRCVYGEFNI